MDNYKGMNTGLASIMSVNQKIKALSNPIGHNIAMMKQPLRSFKHSIDEVKNTFKTVTDIGKITSPKSITDAFISANNITKGLPNFNDFIGVEQITKPITTFSDPITAFTNPVKSVYNHFSFLTSPIYKSPSGLEGLKGVMNWHNSITTFQSELYPVLNTSYFTDVKKVTDSLNYLKDATGQIDFSKHNLISDSFLKVTEFLSGFAFENDVEIDADYIESELNIALNKDYSDRKIDNSEISFHVVNHYLQKLYTLLLSIKNEGENLNNAITFLINKPQKSTFEITMFWLLSLIINHHANNFLFPTTNSTIETQINSSIQIISDTMLKDMPNENSYTICKVEAGTAIIKVIPDENNRHWVKIEFIDSNDVYQVGWILNNNLEY